MKRMRRYLMAMIVGLWVWAIAPLPMMAQSIASPGNQALNLSASLVAPDPDMEIAIYPQPNTRRPRIGFGLNGDPVTVVEQTGSNGGVTWNRIQFEGADDAEGWVQLEYLSIQSEAPPDQTTQSNYGRDRYMGSRAHRNQASASRPTYGQPGQRRQVDQRQQPGQQQQY